MKSFGLVLASIVLAPAAFAANDPVIACLVNVQSSPVQVGNTLPVQILAIAPQPITGLEINGITVAIKEPKKMLAYSTSVRPANAGPLQVEVRVSDGDNAATCTSDAVQIAELPTCTPPQVPVKTTAMQKFEKLVTVEYQRAVEDVECRMPGQVP